MKSIKLKGRDFTNQQIFRLVDPLMRAAVNAKANSKDAFLTYIETLDTIQNWLVVYSIKANINLEKWIFNIYNHKSCKRVGTKQIKFEDRKYKKYELEDLLNRIFHYAQDAVNDRLKDDTLFRRGLCREFANVMSILAQWLKLEGIPTNYDLDEWVARNLAIGAESAENRDNFFTATTALAKFYAKIDQPKTNEIFFRYRGIEYQICYRGCYIIVEDPKNDYAEEFCFSENGKERIEAFLNAKVDRTGKTIREIISELSEDDLIVTT